MGFAFGAAVALAFAGVVGFAVAPAVLSPDAAAAACSWRFTAALLVPTARLALSTALWRPVWPGAVAAAGVEPESLFGRSTVNFAAARTTIAASAISTGFETWSTLHVSAPRAAT